MLESMSEWMGFPMYYAFEGAAPPPRAGAAHATIYPYGPFEAGDGRSVMLGVQNEREWLAFCATVLEQRALARDPRFDSNPQRLQHKAQLQAIIDGVLRQLDADEVVARLERAGIANARVNDMQALWDHPQLQARERWTTVDSPAGALPALQPPASNSSFTARMDAVPALGEHTDTILAELGYTPEARAQLRRDGVV